MRPEYEIWMGAEEHVVAFFPLGLEHFHTMGETRGLLILSRGNQAQLHESDLRLEEGKGRGNWPITSCLSNFFLFLLTFFVIFWVLT